MEHRSNPRRSLLQREFNSLRAFGPHLARLSFATRARRISLHMSGPEYTHSYSSLATRTSLSRPTAARHKAVGSSLLQKLLDLLQYVGYYRSDLVVYSHSISGVLDRCASDRIPCGPCPASFSPDSTLARYPAQWSSQCCWGVPWQCDLWSRKRSRRYHYQLIVFTDAGSKMQQICEVSNLKIADNHFTSLTPISTEKCSSIRKEREFLEPVNGLCNMRATSPGSLNLIVVLCYGSLVGRAKARLSYLSSSPKS
jgi:hypothetical protein